MYHGFKSRCFRGPYGLERLYSPQWPQETVQGGGRGYNSMVECLLCTQEDIGSSPFISRFVGPSPVQRTIKSFWTLMGKSRRVLVDHKVLVCSFFVCRHPFYPLRSSYSTTKADGCGGLETRRMHTSVFQEKRFSLRAAKSFVVKERGSRADGRKLA